MRTTVRIDDELLKQAKTLAAEKGTTLTQIFEDALRAHVAAGRRTAGAAPYRVVPFDPGQDGGLQPGVDLDDSAALLELMEQDDPPV